MMQEYNTTQSHVNELLELLFIVCHPFILFIVVIFIGYLFI